MLHEKIRSVAEALNTHKDRVPDNDGDTWKLLHNAASNLFALASNTEMLETQFVPHYALRRGGGKDEDAEVLQ